MAVPVYPSRDRRERRAKRETRRLEGAVKTLTSSAMDSMPCRFACFCFSVGACLFDDDDGPPLRRGARCCDGAPSVSLCESSSYATSPGEVRVSLQAAANGRNEKLLTVHHGGRCASEKRPSSAP